jgi:cyclic pyranopterin phosphate synthase
MACIDKTLQDRYGRPINSLRISLTQRCNFSCFFCHREGEDDQGAEMTPGEIEDIVAVASSFGICKIKLTGGEPLMRADIVEVVKRIAPYVDELSMTTNGSLLAEKAADLREAGLRRVNISFHSLCHDNFRKITGSDSLMEVKRGIDAAIENDLRPVKLNVVVMKGVNADEIADMIEFSKDVGAILQLIEYQPIQGGAEGWDRFYSDLKPVESMLEKRSFEVEERELHRRRQYHLSGGGVVEVVRPMHNSEFCRFCTRLRVTSDGRLKPCLMRNDNLVEAVSLIRRGGPRKELEHAFREAVQAREPFWRD